MVKIASRNTLLGYSEKQLKERLKKLNIERIKANKDANKFYGTKQYKPYAQKRLDVYSEVTKTQSVLANKAIIELQKVSVNGLQKESTNDIMMWTRHSKYNNLNNYQLSQMSRVALINHYVKVKRKQNREDSIERHKLRQLRR